MVATKWICRKFVHTTTSQSHLNGHRPMDSIVSENRLINSFLRHRWVAKAPRRYQQQEEKEGLDRGWCFHCC